MYVVYKIKNKERFPQQKFDINKVDTHLESYSRFLNMKYLALKVCGKKPTC